MPIERKWEHFDGGPAAAPGRAGVRVTINRNGLIYMNDRAYELIGRPEAVELYYCRADDAIALEPARPRGERNFLVRKKQGGWAVHASTFCRHYRLSVATTEQFLGPERDSEGKMILSLRGTITVGGKGRRAGTENEKWKMHNEKV